MSEQLVKRLRELSNAVTRADWNEFSMRIPVEKDRDADFVLLQAADKIEALEADAARYRFLQAATWHIESVLDDQNKPDAEWSVSFYSKYGARPNENDSDRAIDDAMKGGA